MRRLISGLHCFGVLAMPVVLVFSLISASFLFQWNEMNGTRSLMTVHKYTLSFLSLFPSLSRSSDSSRFYCPSANLPFLALLCEFTFEQNGDNIS
jgi:hypothetical protein